jgi:hypothetical protein
MALLRSADPSAAPLVAPAIVAAFDGWIDAAGASTAAATHIADGGETIASFDTDRLYDYRARRPVLDIVDGTLTELTWPDLSIRRVHRGGRDLLILTGPEPDFRWQQLGGELVTFAMGLGVVEWVSMGSLPTAVAHTRPVPILATSSREGLLHGDEQKGPAGLLRVPSAALSTLEFAITENGVPTVGFYAQLPHYVNGPYAAGTAALLEHVGRHLGVDLPLGDLVEAAAAQRRRLDAAVAADDESRAYVARLEEIAGEEQRIPSGDEIAGEIERFLQQRPGDDAGEAGPFRNP